MKCYFILREDLEYSSDRLFRIAVQGTSSIENFSGDEKEWRENPKSETYMMFNMNFLYKLEKKLIEDGVYFKWIEDCGVTVGILIEPTNDYGIAKRYLDDCLTLDHYAKWRVNLMNELKSTSKGEDDDKSANEK